MIIAALIICAIIGIVLLFVAFETENGVIGTISAFLLIIAVAILIFGCFNGFINYPKTEGTHIGVITAVDLEGVYFRRYEVYLKSSGYTPQGDETVYKLYEYEKEFAEELKNLIGKEVKITYGHDGGYIGSKSCGTYHIKDVEEVKKEE